jgi:hypothetical protein
LGGSQVLAAYFKDILARRGFTHIADVEEKKNEMCKLDRGVSLVS